MIATYILATLLQASIPINGSTVLISFEDYAERPIKKSSRLVYEPGGAIATVKLDANGRTQNCEFRQFGPTYPDNLTCADLAGFADPKLLEILLGHESKDLSEVEIRMLTIPAGTAPPADVSAPPKGKYHIMAGSMDLTFDRRGKLTSCRAGGVVEKVDSGSFCQESMTEADPIMLVPDPNAPVERPMKVTVEIIGK